MRILFKDGFTRGGRYGPQRGGQRNCYFQCLVCSCLALLKILLVLQQTAQQCGGSRKKGCRRSVAPLPLRSLFWLNKREGSPGSRSCVFSSRVCRFLSFLYQRYGRADVDGASWNNSPPTHACLLEATLAPARGLWSSSYWSGFDLTQRHSVVTGLGCSWSATGLSVACLWKMVRDPAA
jgi:hypothetical protein